MDGKSRKRASGGGVRCHFAHFQTYLWCILYTGYTLACSKACFIRDALNALTSGSAGSIWVLVAEIESKIMCETK